MDHKKFHRTAIERINRIMSDVAELDYIASQDEAAVPVKNLTDLTGSLGRVIRAYTHDITKLREAYRNA